MHLNEVTISTERYPTTEHYPFNLPTFHQTKQLVFHSPVSFFVGENGTGKSTLLRAICRKCDIHIWEGVARRRYDVNPYEGELHTAIDVRWTNGAVPGSFFASELFKNFAQLIDEWAVANPGQLEYFGGKSLLTQSHGQSLMSFFRSRYQIKGLYLLDEPETALSPKTQLELLGLLKEMSRAGHAQFVIATHSPILMACPGARIYSFDGIPIREMDYKETAHFKIYHSFMENPGRYMN
ncbi:AAA family ATPase [Thermodesulfobacteriota bacterium]